MQAIHNGVGTTVKGIDKVLSGLKKAGFETEKSLNTAVRVEGFRLKKLLQQQIRSGAPGGKRLAPLSFIARRIRRRPNRKPLERLAVGIRYQVMSKSPFAMAIGWVGPQTGFDARLALQADRFGRGIKEGHHVSKSWRRIAHFQQQGFTRSISDDQRRFIVRRGSVLGTVQGGNTPFFLKKSTRVFKTPSRPIIDPFWTAQQKTAVGNIRRNFKLKLKGQRI